ncbi:MAG: class I SAM-dependent methyltransferase [Dehalococcoidia bacterium]
MALNPTDAFSAMAEDYDSIARRGMPVYDEMLNAVMACLVDGARDVVELGCGTGALTVRLAQRFPAAAITALDASPKMVDIARGRLEAARAAERVTLRVGLFEEIDLAGGSCDLIASNMSVHHVLDKQPVYTKLREALRSGGMLVLGDEVQSVLPHIEERFWNDWLEFARRPGGLTEPEVAEIIRHVDEIDYYETLPRQIELLSLAGFREVDCVWRKLNYTVFVAKP